ncbi:hypothetical protein [Paenibacillus wynnii]|uniref:hypothetical protein n=1 Tax=Paenibacillus wynnii TaxID=268407 RepID=UPI0027927CE8|nr:hypothetical protein [Paenibacillus wynnii]MDQ0195151.1 multisubunit Na+/H+ antiporter MnhB subunit [Paenibacillus wynnii]
MSKKNQPGAVLAASALLIVLSTQIHPENSPLLGIVQTVLLGVGMVGCCMAIWTFSRGSRKK